MCEKTRMALAGLLSAALVIALAPMAFGAGHGGGHGGGGGHFGGGGGGWSGGGSSFHGGGSFHASPGFHGSSGGGIRTFAFSQPSHSLGQPSHFAPASSGRWNQGWNGARSQAWGRSYSGNSWSHSNTLNHGNYWAENHGDWNHGSAKNWNRGGWYGGWWPWYSFAWWPGYAYGWRGYGYPDYYAYYGDDSGYTPYYTGYGSSYAGPPYSAAYESSDATQQTEGDFATEAVAAFRRGDYREAARLAGHASIDDPRDSNVHLILSLALFATGDYRGAAMEAHAVAALGPVPDWATVYGIYDNVDVYTDQLRALEKYNRENPSSPEGRFLLGFQYMMTGHQNAARRELVDAVRLEPKDRLAAQLLTQVGGKAPSIDAAESPEAKIPQAPQPPNSNAITPPTTH